MPKHNPEMDLPWRAIKRDGAFQVLTDDNVRVASLNYAHGVAAAHDCQRANADYIAHACNAYPQLVEALRKIARTPSAGNMAEARASAFQLLGELGEAQ